MEKFSKMFAQPGLVPPSRITYSLEGQTKVGKSSFGLWGPNPGIVFNVDNRLQHVLPHFLSGAITGSPKRIEEVRIEIPEIEPMSKKKDEKAQTLAEKEWNKLLDTYTAATKSSFLSGGVRMITMDDISEIYDLRLIAEFGRTQGIQQRDRGAPNMDIFKLIDMGKESKASVVWISKVKEEWGTKTQRNNRGEEEQVNATTGRWIPDGYKRLRAAVEVALAAKILPSGQFAIEVLSSGVNASTNGTVYTAEDWGDFGPFAWVSQEQMPHTSIADWLSE
jgi:hypothetical protein